MAFFFQVRDAELSWLDARIAKRKAITADPETEESKENEQFDEDEKDLDDIMEVSQDPADVTVVKRMTNIKVISADTFCLEPILAPNIPSHQVSSLFF